MGTITARKRKDGTMGYTARVRIMQDGRTYQEAKTFDRRPAAKAWIKKREKSLAEPGAIEARHRIDPALDKVIDKYVEENERDLGRTKAQVLRTIKTHDIASMRCSSITSADIVQFLQGLKSSPQTRMNYASHLSAIFALARPAWGYPLDRVQMQDAMVVAKRMGITSKSKSRDRRPTLEELDMLMNRFISVRKRRPGSIPMVAIVAFAIFSTRRQEEITRMRWDDLDEKNDTILIRDMKNPGEKIGNNVRCKLPPEAMAIIQTQRHNASERIFPYTTDAIGAAFTRACKMLGIKDLRFHDCRHEGTTRLFECGMTIPQVAVVTGHQGWVSLKRYTHIATEGDKYEGWPWLSVSCEG